MYDPTKFPHDHPIQLWARTRKLLHKRVGDSWQLLYGPGFYKSWLMKPNVCIIELIYQPRDGEQLGRACTMLYPTPKMTKGLAVYLAKVHKSALPKPKNDPDTLQLGLYKPDGKPLDVLNTDIDDLTGTHKVATVVGIQTPQGTVLYEKLAPWYIESAEAICDFMYKYGLWNKENGIFPLHSQDDE
jgi:hypothetical protein